MPPRDDSYIAVTFRVNEALRGDFDDTIVIRTDPANSSASYRFEIGHDYLVFADLHNGRLYTNSCTGNRAVATETAFIRELRAARRSQPVSSVADVVEGRFELKQVPPGRYRIRFFPKVSGHIESYYYPGKTSETAAVEVEVGDGTVITGLQFTIP